MKVFDLIKKKGMLSYFKYRTKGLDFKKAETQEDLDKVFHLRWLVYGLEEGYINPDDYPDQKFSDKYDDYSVSFLATKYNEPIGTLRLVRYSNLKFPLEEYFNVKFSKYINKNKMNEVSRLAISKKFRKIDNRMVMLGLIINALKTSKELGLRHWCFYIPSQLKKSFEKFGIQLTSIPEKQLTKKQYCARNNFMKGYFRKNNPRPYIIGLKDLLFI